jgi:hypothetical protein
MVARGREQTVKILEPMAENAPRAAVLVRCVDLLGQQLHEIRRDGLDAIAYDGLEIDAFPIAMGKHGMDAGHRSEPPAPLLRRSSRRHLRCFHPPMPLKYPSAIFGTERHTPTGPATVRPQAPETGILPLAQL